MNRSPDPAAPARILVRGVNWLGDAVMTTPALLRLREKFPASHIGLLTHRKLAHLWEHHPAVDGVIPFSPGESPWAVARRVRAGRFDVGVVLPNSFRSALEVFLAGVPERVGCRRGGRAWLLTRALAERATPARMRKRSVSEIRRLTAAGQAGRPETPDGSRAHQLFDYLHLVSSLGATADPLPPLLRVTEAELAEVRNKFLSDRGLPSACVVLGLNPGAEYGPAKRWPAENFAATARQIQATSGRAVWLLFGGPADIETCSRIAAAVGPGAVNLAGQTSLRELMCLLKLCRALLTNDTGPMHVAAAMGTPVVVPFGSTSPELTGPGLPGDSSHRWLRSGAPCAPCFLRVCPIDFRCMTGIRPETAVSALHSVVPQLTD